MSKNKFNSIGVIVIVATIIVNIITAIMTVSTNIDYTIPYLPISTLVLIIIFAVISITLDILSYKKTLKNKISQ